MYDADQVAVRVSDLFVTTEGTSVTLKHFKVAWGLDAEHFSHWKHHPPCSSSAAQQELEIETHEGIFSSTGDQCPPLKIMISMTFACQLIVPPQQASFFSYLLPAFCLLLLLLYAMPTHGLPSLYIASNRRNFLSITASDISSLF